MTRPYRVLCVAVMLGLFAGCDKPSTEAGATNPKPSIVASDYKGPVTLTSGSVQVTQCKFDGVEKAITEARGKVVLVDCWATWCGPCVSSFPKLVEKHRTYGSKGLVVISMSTDRIADMDKVLAFLHKQDATFTNIHLWPDASSVKGLQETLAWRDAIPHTILFDRTGKRVWSGHPLNPNLTSLIEAELAKP